MARLAKRRWWVELLAVVLSVAIAVGMILGIRAVFGH
jgi:hypothetical protein